MLRKQFTAERPVAGTTGHCVAYTLQRHKLLSPLTCRLSRFAVCSVWCLLLSHAACKAYCCLYTLQVEESITRPLYVSTHYDISSVDIFNVKHFSISSDMCSTPARTKCECYENNKTFKRRLKTRIGLLSNSYFCCQPQPPSDCRHLRFSLWC